jgi:hypothetical protein
MDSGIEQDVTGSQTERAPDSNCSHCGAVAEGSWHFCGTCGKPLGTAPTAEPAVHAFDGNPDGDAPRNSLEDNAPPAAEPLNDRSPTRPRRSRLSLALYWLGAVMLLALVCWGGYAYQQTRNDLADTRSDLSTASDQLDETNASLSETKDSLASNRSDSPTPQTSCKRHKIGCEPPAENSPDWKALLTAPRTGSICKLIRSKL